MKSSKESRHSSRRKERSKSSQSRVPYLGLDPRNGVPIQCQYCSGQSFRRSTLRGDDFTQLMMMRYPVRCLRCNQRQLVSFTVASLALSASERPRRRHRPVDPNARWIDFTRHPDLPKPFSTDQPGPGESAEDLSSPESAEPSPSAGREQHSPR